jgi:hypothetical protein
LRQKIEDLIGLDAYYPVEAETVSRAALRRRVNPAPFGVRHFVLS